MTMLYPNLCYNEVCYKGTAVLLKNTTYESAHENSA